MKTILLIDDDEDMLAMTGRWLEKAGYAVSKASSGAEGLALLSEKNPDLILLDYAMPQMNGPAVLKEIRSNEAYDNIPVLYRTGMDDMTGDEGSVKPDGVVPKSEGKPSLLRTVSGILG